MTIVHVDVEWLRGSGKSFGDSEANSHGRGTMTQKRPKQCPNSASEYPEHLYYLCSVKDGHMFELSRCHPSFNFELLRKQEKALQRNGDTQRCLSHNEQFKQVRFRNS